MTIKKKFIDPVLREIERSLQKARLRRRIRQSIRGKKHFFKNYLQNAYSLTELPNQHQTLKDHIDENFKGKTKEALSEHLQVNIQKGKQVDEQFKNFTRHF